MRHVPFFRWVLTLGVLLIGCSAAVYTTAPEMPELRQVDLTVLEEAPDGACTVRWKDPFDQRRHEAPYRCDTTRDPVLKAPNHDLRTGHGWDTGFVVAEGGARGELYSRSEDDEAAGRIGLSDTLTVIGLLLTITGLVGGNIRAVPRLRGVDPDVVRRAWDLAHAAVLVAEDYEKALAAVRTAWDPLHQERVNEELGRIPVSRLRHDDRRRFSTKEWQRAGIRTVRDVLDADVWTLGLLPGVGRRTAERAVAAAQRMAEAKSADVLVRITPDSPEPRTMALISALHVLVEAGPAAHATAGTAGELAARLELLLTEAPAATGCARMPQAGPEQRRRTRAALAELRHLLDAADRNSVAEEFRQTSADLLRGPDTERDAMSAWLDFASRSDAYYRLLTEVTSGAVNRRGRSPVRDSGSKRGERHPNRTAGTGHIT
ncbi:helix-hairpin-helix domain-containing protein [Streptomyces sp. RTGN2]|uniref:helix-hairpin-helix domain-containing protein n=1 Tax=Streptomyces sp. RTGN2 TaxID=3016525 RepID=UPI002556BEC1|nr:helix-hairpin-helix domain-containing protein [Streptomyces sp. RTGN2]